MSERQSEGVCGVTAARGFRAAAVRAGIKASRKRDDLVLIVSDKPAAVAATFTTNPVRAACVDLDRRHLAGGRARAIVVNAGVANACTGSQGVADALRMAELTAAALKIPVHEVFVCQTGTIGIPMPMPCVEAAFPSLVGRLAREQGAAAAEGILTTDLVRKTVVGAIEIDGCTITLGGMAKGSGMIAPNLATMLAFFTTDAAVAPDALQRALGAAVEQSFNRILVDGDESTNDTVLLLANGASQAPQLDEDHPAWPRFTALLDKLTLDLALQIVRDGEGATKFVSITVEGADSADDARLAARAVACSPLCKTSWFGGDPNWGRVIAAVGYSGAALDPELIEIDFDAVAVVRNGQPAAGLAIAELERVFKQKAFAITIRLRHGGASAYTVYTCDLSAQYVAINADYMT